MEGLWHEDERIATGKLKIKKPVDVAKTTKQKMKEMRKAS